MGRRIIRLLAEPPALTGRQIAQRKYRQTEKGRAAHARGKAKARLKEGFKEKEFARYSAWKAAHPVEVRVYNRIYLRRRRRERREAQQQENHQ
jgi:hypothetical protein